MRTKLQLLITGILSGVIAVFIFQKISTPPTTSLAIEQMLKAPQYTPTALRLPTNGTGIKNNDFINAAKQTIDGVVHVKNISSMEGASSSWLRNFYGLEEPTRVGTGSGVIVSSDGYIITNYHVIEDATDIEVTTNDNKRYNATLMGSDAYTDIAVLKIEAEEVLPYIVFGDSETTQIGEWVLAVGNPYNLNSTVTAGIISAKSRDLNTQDDKNQFFLQTDAAVNRGNSGGALVNLKGELIGINTAITSLTGGFVGYSFAVPSNIARKVFEDLLEYGSVQKGLLGVQGAALNADVANRFEVGETEGFYISSVMENMGAAQAGLQTEDIIKRIDGVKINKFSDLTGHLSSKRPGDKVIVDYVRDGQAKTTTILLKKTTRANFIGLVLENAEAKELEQLDLEYGVKIGANNNRGLNRYGIDAGYFILEINKKKIENVDEITNYSFEDVDSILFMSPEGERVLIPFRY